MANFDYPGESATQAIYNDEWAPFRSNLGATTALANLDFYCQSGTVVDAAGNPVSYPCPANHQSSASGRISSPRSTSCPRIGMSYYNAGQLVLHHPTSHGLTLDFSYTFSNSIDMGSDAERGTEFNGRIGGNFSNITQHLETLPEPRPLGLRYPSPHYRGLGLSAALRPGRRYLSSANTRHQRPSRRMAMVGHQSLVQRPALQPSEPGWTTDWQIGSYGVVTGKVKMQKHILNGSPQVFADPAAINAEPPPVVLSVFLIPVMPANATTSAVTESSASIPGWPNPGSSRNTVRSNSTGRSSTSPTVSGSTRTEFIWVQGLTGGNLGSYSAMQNAAAAHAVWPSLRLLTCVRNPALQPMAGDHHDLRLFFAFDLLQPGRPFQILGLDGAATHP